jgi:hypothetical protein
MKSSTFSSKPSAWFKTKVFSLSSLILCSFFLVGCGGANYDDDGNNGTNRTLTSKELTGFTFGSGDIKSAAIGANSVDIAIDYISTNNGYTTNQAPTVNHTGKSYSPAGVVDFATLPTTYTITADDNSENNYSVVVRRAFVVSSASELANAIDNIAQDIAGGLKPINYITIFVTQDINLTSNITIPSTWAGRYIRLENNNPAPDIVTIGNLRIQGGNNTVERIRVNLSQSNASCLPNICNSYDFNWTIRNNLNGTHNLTDDIDLSGYSDWEPIGNSTHPFTGILNGNNHTISGLRFKDWDNNATFIGLFGNVSGGKIRDLKVVANSTPPIYLIRDVNPFDNQYFGVLAGYIDNGANIARITVSVSPSSTIEIIKSGQANLHVGGVVGFSDSALIERSASFVTLNVTNAYYNGDSDKRYITSVGGIAGFNFNTSKIENSYATGDITTNTKQSTYGGGITGFNWGGEIDKSYTNGTIWVKGSFQTFVGGIAGKNSYGGNIRYSAALNPSITVSSSVIDQSGAWRIAAEGTFANNIALENMAVSGTNTIIGDNGDNKTLIQLQADITWQSLYWDFYNIWYWNSTTKRPELR